MCMSESERCRERVSQKEDVVLEVIKERRMMKEEREREGESEREQVASNIANLS